MYKEVRTFSDNSTIDGVIELNAFCVIEMEPRPTRVYTLLHCRSFDENVSVIVSKITEFPTTVKKDVIKTVDHT